jgi:hypothetical protein
MAAGLMALGSAEQLESAAVLRIFHHRERREH